MTKISEMFEVALTSQFNFKVGSSMRSSDGLLVDQRSHQRLITLKLIK